MDHAPILKFASLAPGSLFADRYRIHQRCGAGATGEVFRATDELANLEVGLKVLFPSGDRNRFARLRRELRILRELDHRSIVKVHDIGEREGLFYLVMEFLTGETLKDRLARHGPLSESEARQLLGQILAALSIAHGAGVVHRDLKPANILLTSESGESRAVLLDFGLARGVPDATVTRSGAFVGTPTYMSPEQLAAGPVDQRSDLYSLGVVLWEMMNGVPPFQSESIGELIEAHHRSPIPRFPPPLRNAGPWARDLLQWLLQKDVRQRPQSAEEVIRSLTGDGWVQRARRRWSLGRLRSGGREAGILKGLGFVAASGMALMLWLLPVSIEGRGETGLRVTNVVGATIAHHSLPIHYKGHVRVPGSWLRPEFIAMVFLPDSVRPIPDDYPFGLVRVSGWGRAVTPLTLSEDPVTRRLPMVFPNQDASYFPSSIDLMPRPAGDERLMALTYNHRQFPSLVMLATSGGSVRATVNHPGSLSGKPMLVPTARGDVLICAAVNNLVGGHGAVFAVAQPGAPLFSGTLSVPPYAGPVFRERNVLWYTFISQRPGPMARTSGGNILVDYGDRSVELDPERGVPVSPEEREGLSEVAWLKAQEELITVLKLSAAQLNDGRPEVGGRFLAEYAHHVAADPSQRSVALYQSSALYRTAGQFERALELATEGEETAPKIQGHSRLQVDILTRLHDWDELEQRAARYLPESLAANEFRRDLFIARLLANRIEDARKLIPTFESGYYVKYTQAMLDLHLGQPERALEGLAALPDVRSPDVHFFEAMALALQSSTAAALGSLAVAEEGKGDGQAMPFDLLRSYVMSGNGVIPDRSTIETQLERQALAAHSNIVDLYFYGVARLLAEAMMEDLAPPTRPDLQRTLGSLRSSGLASAINQTNHTPRP